MQTIRLLYPDWLIIAIIAIIIILAFVSIIYFCIFIKYIHSSNYIETTDEHQPEYFIRTLDGDNLINVEEIAQVVKRYNKSDDHFNIVYYLRNSNVAIVEDFFDGLECEERLRDIEKILNNCIY